MAQTAATNTGQFAGFLRPNEAANYFEETRKSSIVQSLARQVPLGINGEEITVSTAKPTAGWVSEGGQKPTTEGALGVKSMKPHKIAAITVVSAEVVRANPKNYIEIFKADIAEAFGLAFDAAVLHGTNSPFGAGQNLSATTKAVELGTATQANGGIYADLNGALKLLVDDGKKLTGFAFDSVVEPTLNGAVDLNGRPLFVDAPYDSRALTAGRVLGRQAFLGDGVKGGTTVGFAGNWNQIVWGAVGGISYDVSTQATVTLGGDLVSLWEHNLVAIRAEAEFGVLLNDAESFVKITDAA